MYLWHVTNMSQIWPFLWINSQLFLGRGTLRLILIRSLWKSPKKRMRNWGSQLLLYVHTLAGLTPEVLKALATSSGNVQMQQLLMNFRRALKNKLTASVIWSNLQPMVLVQMFRKIYLTSNFGLGTWQFLQLGDATRSIMTVQSALT